VNQVIPSKGLLEGKEFVSAAHTEFFSIFPDLFRNFVSFFAKEREGEITLFRVS